VSQAGDSAVYAAIEEAASTSAVNGQLSGEYVLRIDLDGYIVGFGLSAMADIAGDGIEGPTSTFVVKAQSFAVVYPRSGTDDIIIPFVIGLVDGRSTVGINGALVVDGTITARHIQAESIGAREINAGSVWADLVTANRIISSTFSTGPSPQTRVEINGVGTAGELYPLWYGQGSVSGQASATSSPYFYLTKAATMVLAGELRVTGAGKFYVGSDAAVGGTEYRVEIGGYLNNTLIWVGKGPITVDKESNTWVFYIDKAGNAKFRGDVEARFVSGEISRVLSINRYVAKSAPKPATNYTDTANIPDTAWVLIDEYILPESVFDPHLPTMHVDVSFYGTGVRAAAVRVSFRAGNGVYQELIRSVMDISTYGGFRSISATALTKVAGVSYFKIEFCGFNSAAWSGSNPVQTSRQIGYLHGIR
jgi:hypothetical protein